MSSRNTNRPDCPREFRCLSETDEIRTITLPWGSSFEAYGETISYATHEEAVLEYRNTIAQWHRQGYVEVAPWLSLDEALQVRPPIDKFLELKLRGEPVYAKFFDQRVALDQFGILVRAYGDCIKAPTCEQHASQYACPSDLVVARQSAFRHGYVRTDDDALFGPCSDVETDDSQSRVDMVFIGACREGWVASYEDGVLQILACFHEDDRAGPAFTFRPSGEVRDYQPEPDQSTSVISMPEGGLPIDWDRAVVRHAWGPVRARFEEQLFSLERAAVPLLQCEHKQYAMLPFAGEVERRVLHLLLVDRFYEGGPGPVIKPALVRWDNPSPSLLLTTFVESLVVALYLTNKRRSEIQAPPRVFTRDEEVLVVDYMPMSIDRHPGSPSAPRSEEALLVSYCEEVYHVEHLAKDPQTRASQRVQEILDDGFTELGGAGSWSRPRFDEIVTWRGADGSRIDATFLPRKAGAKRTNRAASWRVDRMQGVEASGDVLWRLRLVAYEDSLVEQQWAIVFEDFTSEKPTIHTARSYHNKGRSLTVHWDEEASAQYAVPDPDPLERCSSRPKAR